MSKIVLLKKNLRRNQIILPFYIAIVYLCTVKQNYYFSSSPERLAADRRVFHDMIEELLPYVLPIWQLYHGQVVQIFSNGSQTFADESQVTPIIEKSVLVLKVIRKAVVHGLRKPCENEHAMLLLKTLIEQIRIVLPYRK